ncbi:MAG: SDR family NAD(P)-dependent oxidoreductase [Clostridia bacterium]|nr:SDR family NAD(P)-dependent oxidoreductase [Clostridia bacterium]MBQ7289067.1 SDR family NAD(P)-dependent oxidoreductase [Clostridia bacterium]
MKKIAVITGASTGLGAEFLKQLPIQFPEIEEVWTIQRRPIQTSSGKIPVKEILLDLTERQSFTHLKQIFAEQKPEIRLLINNAGSGKIGNLADCNYEEQGCMIDLNNRAATLLTALCLPYMARGAMILNVASIAAFAPNPRMTVYSATKAYLLSFSKSLREEIKPLGIHCTAICPGPMCTEFLSVAGIEKGTSKAFDTLPYCIPSKVAAQALKSVKRNRILYTPRLFYKFYYILAKLLPHGLIMKISKT